MKRPSSKLQEGSDRPPVRDSDRLPHFLGEEEEEVARDA
jgi:hypothetical protein